VAFTVQEVKAAPEPKATPFSPVPGGTIVRAVGYIGWGAKNLDTAIAIRTAVMKGGQAWVQAGAGIVADSDPQKELEETEAKARGVLTALAHAARQRG
ncbi:MAG TPA: chorismate-binding protein, partial [Gemmatimonadales bacterium]